MIVTSADDAIIVWGSCRRSVEEADHKILSQIQIWALDNIIAISLENQWK